MPEPVYYGDYLHLDRLLSAQELETAKTGEAAHDEMLFIVVHQAYELWFKQILWELDSIVAIFDRDVVPEADMGTAVERLRRVNEIQDLLIRQVDVLETMTPLDFLEFRDHLVPASGFQSVQFRVIENRLGLRPDDRLRLSGSAYTARLDEHDEAVALAAAEQPSLFDVVERWLERTPFLDHGHFDFWSAYQQAVHDRLQSDRTVVERNPHLGDEERAGQLSDFEGVLSQYEAIFDRERYEAEREAGRFRLSHRAFQAALFITLYRDHPAAHQAHRLLELLMDIDEALTAWRHRHAQMAMRMIGRRVGTGGSAGAKYLERSAAKTRIFADLFSLTTFLVPRADRPDLPDEIVEAMRFRHEA